MQKSEGNIFDFLLREMKLPRFAAVAYDMESVPKLNIAHEIDKTLADRKVLARVKSGMRIAITAGSREMDNMVDIFRAIVSQVKDCGANPFVVPAMGSHGGAAAEGQRSVLEGYGLTEAALGCPILSSMETVYIGESKSGFPVYIDKYAAEADGIIVVNRIKPHTDFRGKVESGLMKMMTIGLGKQYGASVCHEQGFGRMAQNVWEFGQEILEKANVLFGIAIIENAYHNTYAIKAIPAELIPEEEPILLEKAKSLMPRIPFDNIDSLYVQEIGKDISGAGMDSNVTGRSLFLPPTSPHAKTIVVQDITEKSHGNGTGIGLAQVTTARAFHKLRFETTYPNAITSRDADGVKIPPVMPSDELAFKMAKRLSNPEGKEEEYRIVWIRNTLSLRLFYISEALLSEARENPRIHLITDFQYLEFGTDGNLARDYWGNF